MKLAISALGNHLRFIFTGKVQPNELISDLEQNVSPAIQNAVINNATKRGSITSEQATQARKALGLN